MAFGSRKANKEIKRLIKTRPKYEITDEAYENQALARADAFGRDRAFQMQEQTAEQQAADAVSQVKDVTTGTSSLLSTIAAIRANQDANSRQLTTDEAQLQQQKRSQLLGVNTQMIDEKDKAWNYNVNMPYQLLIQQQRERLKRAQAITDSFSGVALAVGSGAATGAGAENSGGSGGQASGIFGAIFSDERTKKNIDDYQHGLCVINKLRPVSYEYKWSEQKHIGFIAQEIRDVLPEIVVVDESSSHEYLKININELIPVLVKAVQEQQLQILKLKKELESIKTPA